MDHKKHVEKHKPNKNQSQTGYPSSSTSHTSQQTPKSTTTAYIPPSVIHPPPQPAPPQPPLPASDSQSAPSYVDSGLHDSLNTKDSGKDTSEHKFYDKLCVAVRKMGYSLKVEEPIGEGAFSRVYRARSIKIQNRDIAVKIVRVNDPNIPQAWKEHSMRRELKILKRIKHPNVITTHDIVKTRTRIYIFMDLAATSVASHLEATEEPASEQTARSWFSGISSALSYLHHCEIAHRDLKNDNLLIDSNGSAKLTDFGFACFTYDKHRKSEILSRTSCGTKAYVAPEVLNPPYNPKLADIWSLGVCMYECVTLARPFQDELPTHLFIKSQLEKGFNLPRKFKSKLSEPLQDLLRRMIEPDVNKRIKSDSLLVHPWMKLHHRR